MLLQPSGYSLHGEPPGVDKLQKKPHTIGENLVKPCALKMAEIILGKEAANELATVSLSTNTVQRRINDMVNDIKDQVVNEI